jgi:hypothetical protein
VLPSVAAAVVIVGSASAQAAQRLYWSNIGANKINLDTTSGGDLPITGAAVEAPDGISLDPAAGRIYRAGYSSQNIGYANLDGSGGANFNTSGATSTQP